jgi:hypothetical protein
VDKWLGEGGVQEDRPGSDMDYVLNNPTRSANHFHNTLLPWAEAGLNDTFILHKTGQSSVLWAQNPNQSLGGNWSWLDARKYFYEALTATTDYNRQLYYANTFRALGQLMHLVQDASVPEHVRNAIHIAAAYEAYVEDTRNSNTGLWNSLINSPKTFDRSILDIPSANLSAPVPISRIVDTDKYDGSNPGVTTTVDNSPQAIGIAEYTNANFLSANLISTNTMFEGFPFPRAVDTVLSTDSTNRVYLKKVGNGDDINHLAAVSILYSTRMRYFPQYTAYLPVGLDEECYKEYAQNLIPRAVGYSAGLLNYFFRGELEVKQAIPVFKNNVIEKITVKVRNYTSTKEALSNGYFTLSYQYTVDGLTVYDKIPYATGMDAIGTPSLPYGKKDDGSDNDVADLVVTFDQFPNSIKITEYPSVKFTLTYFGDLGAEIRDKTGDTQTSVLIGGAVIGKVFKGGKILFNEEWDNGLTGNHPWYHSKWDCETCWYPNIPPSNRGTIDNTVSGGYLQKNDSIYEWPFDGAHSGYMSQGNATYLRASQPEYNDLLPLTITKDTYLLHKIDDISINQPLDGSYQVLFLEFNNGYRIELSSLAVPYTGPNKLLFRFPLGQSIAGNIHDMFRAYGVPVTDDLQLVWIEFLQSMTYNSVPSAYMQSMKVDHIRLIDAKPAPFDAP